MEPAQSVPSRAAADGNALAMMTAEQMTISGAQMRKQELRRKQMKAADPAPSTAPPEPLSAEAEAPAEATQPRRRSWLSWICGGGTESVAPVPVSKIGPPPGDKVVWVLPQHPTLSVEERQRRAALMMQEPAIKAAFDKFDADGSGTVDASEVTEILRQASPDMTTQDIEEMMKRLDNNGDGDLDILEVRPSG